MQTCYRQQCQAQNNYGMAPRLAPEATILASNQRILACSSNIVTEFKYLNAQFAPKCMKMQAKRNPCLEWTLLRACCIESADTCTGAHWNPTLVFWYQADWDTLFPPPDPNQATLKHVPTHTRQIYNDQQRSRVVLSLHVADVMWRQKICNNGHLFVFIWRVYDHTVMTHNQPLNMFYIYVACNKIKHLVVLNSWKDSADQCKSEYRRDMI